MTLRNIIQTVYTFQVVDEGGVRVRQLFVNVGDMAIDFINGFVID